MENNKNEDKSIERKVMLTKNQSESALTLKRLPVNTIDSDNDLRIVGFNVQVDDDVYAFTLNKRRSKSVDVLSILTGSNEVYRQETAQALQPPSDTNKCVSENSTVYSQIISDIQTLISGNISSGNEYGKTQDLQLKIGSTFLENTEFEICIKSKNEEFSSINDQMCLNEENCEEDQPVDIMKITSGKGGSYCVKYFKKSSPATSKYTSEMTSREVATEKEITSAGAELINLKVFNSNTLEDTAKQSKNANSYEILEEMTEPTESASEEFFKNQAATCEEKETAFMPSKTESTDILSTENGCGSLKQTRHSEKVAEKSLDIKNLTLSPLKPIKVTTEEDQIEKNCQFSCGHKKHHDCINNCCYHGHFGDVIPASLLFGQNPLYLASMHNTLNCDVCRCLVNRSCSEITKSCAEKFKSDIHPQYCCECRKNAKSTKDACTSMNRMQNAEDSESIPLVSKIFKFSPSKQDILHHYQADTFSNSEEGKKKVKKNIVVKKSRPPRSENEVENLKSAEIELKKSNSSASRKTISIQLQIRSFESLEQMQKGGKNNVALKVCEASQIETVPFSDTSDVEHHSDISSLLKRNQPTIEINPIDIKLCEKVLLENIAEEQIESNVKNYEKEKEESHQEVFGGIEKESVRNKSKFDLCYSHSEICPCSMCHNEAETVKKIGNSVLHNASNVFHIEKKESSAFSSGRTSPIIIPENFDYITKDGWKPYNRKSEEFLIKRIEATENFHFEETCNEEFFESFTEGLEDACKTVNDHLLSLCPVDDDTVRKAARTLHKRWFQVIASKLFDVVEIMNFIEYFKKFSDTLVKTLFHSVDSNGNNVLHFAFANNKFDLVHELLKSGYAWDLLIKENAFGNTPLMICAISQPSNSADWAVVRKCFKISYVNEKSTKNGQTPLMNASACGSQDMVDLLLDVRANPNLQDKDGSTALMYAAEHGHKKSVKSLMRHMKCDPTIKDKDGETACSIALRNGHQEVAVLIHMYALEKRRLSPNLYTNKHFRFPTTNKTAWRQALATMPVPDVLKKNHSCN